MSTKNCKTVLVTDLKSKPECALRVLIRQHVEALHQQKHSGINANKLQVKIDENVTALFS